MEKLASIQQNKLHDVTTVILFSLGLLPHVTTGGPSANVVGLPMGPEFNMEDGDVISVGEEHYRIIGDDENLKQVGRLDWLSQLVVKEARLEDRGMYICFVTSGGQQGFNFKQSYLSVIEGKSIGNFFFQKNLFRIF